MLLIFRECAFFVKRIQVTDFQMENRKHTSLKDLAQALGVSIPTVSRALKDSPEISRELCAKAKELAKEMNYRPNPFAMSLRKNAPRIIGVVIPDIVTHFFASILNGIENMAIANGYFVIITTSHESYGAFFLKCSNNPLSNNSNIRSFTFDIFFPNSLE